MSSTGKNNCRTTINWPTVLAARIVERIGKGVRTSARDALIAEASSPQYRGRAFGFHRVFDSGGAVIGPLFAILLLYVFNNNLRTVFFLTIIPSIISLVILAYFVKEKTKSQTASTQSPIKWIPGNAPFNRFLFISALFALANSSEAFLIIRAQSLGFSISFTVLAHVLFNLSYTLFAFPVGIMADYISPKKIIIAGYIVFAGTYVLAGIATQAWWMWFILSLYGIFMAMTDSVNKTYITRLVEPTVFGTALGLHQTVVGIGAFLASTMAGLLWAALGTHAPFYFGSGLAAVAATLFLIFHD